MSLPLHLRQLGRVEYEPTWRAMQEFTATRTAETADELWVVEHPPVYTLGQAGKPEHLLTDNGIPLVQIDRGGQITYHAPGQIIAYLLLDLKRHQLGVRELVRKMEQSVVNLLRNHGVSAHGDDAAPGVYLEDGAKIAALGLRVRRGCSYHGLSLNVDLDLTPFGWINPCGYQGMAVSRTADLGVNAPLDQLQEELLLMLHQTITPSCRLQAAAATLPQLPEPVASV